MQKTLSTPAIPGVAESPRTGNSSRAWAAPAKRLLPWLALALLAAGAWAWWRRSASAGSSAITYRTAVIQRGDVIQTVSASGPLSAVSTVSVGSQVSGNISKLYVDFNDVVKVDQIIAEIEPSTYEAALAQAEGDLLSAQAALELKQLNADRSAQLLAKQLLAQADNDQAVADLHQQAAAVKIKEAALKSATINLSRTKIRSPIDGVVIDRTIDVGQTVQASFSAPTLFVLAQDLRQMQVTANVSEADIGGVAPGQTVNFTVDAFPGQSFTGKVNEVRNNSTITNNVVTYATIITVDNPDLKLRPGMTANVIITTAHRAGVLRVPNAALRFRPPEVAGSATVPAEESSHTLYLVRGPANASGRVNGTLEPIVVQTGLSDSAYAEIVSGAEEGAVVATGISLLPATGTSAGGATTNPFMPRMPSTRSPGR